MDSTSVAALQQQASVLQASPNGGLDHPAAAHNYVHQAALFNQHAASAVGGYVSSALSQNHASNYLAAYTQNSAAFQYQTQASGGGSATVNSYGGQPYGGGGYSVGNSISSAVVNNNIDLSSVYSASYAAAQQQQHANPSAYAQQAVAYYSSQYGNHSTSAAAASSNNNNSSASSAYAATSAMAAAAAANSQHHYYLQQQQQQQQQMHANSASPSAVASATAAAAAAAYGMFGFGTNAANGASVGSNLATAVGFHQQHPHHVDLATHYGALHGAPSPDGGGGCGARDNESSTNEASDNAGDGLSHHNGNGSNGGGAGRVTKKGGSKKPRRRPDSPAAEGDMEKIFIWELDETIILLATLLQGKFAKQFQKDDKVGHLHDLGCSMENFIFDVADNSFFHADLSECDQVHIDDVTSDEIVQDLSSYNFAADGFQAATIGAAMCLPTGVRGGVDWMRKLAHRYRVIRDRYTLYRSNIQGILNPATQAEWATCRTQLEEATDCWSSMALKCLSIISARCTKVGREACFERVVQRYGKKPCYVVVGDGADEESVAKQMNLPYWRVACHTDLAALYCALENKHL